MILVTGGMGYIGSHIVASLLSYGKNVLIYDNLSNSKQKTFYQILKIAPGNLNFINGDIRNKHSLNEIFTKNTIESVIHLAGLKSVKESTENPSLYYENNVTGTMNLLEAMDNSNCRRMVFSSSATVYGEPIYLPYDENHPKCPNSPYGDTKLKCEEILQEMGQLKDWNICSLRYFNPVGAHPSGLIGENPNQVPNNLMPILLEVAQGKRNFIEIFGNDYPTKDGSCIRDYIHIMDLVDAHIKALDFLPINSGFHAFNIGTGIGYSVLEMIEAFEKISHLSLNKKISLRRDGDLPEFYANSNLAKEKLKWSPNYGLHEMCRDSFNTIKSVL